jgi:hypothetical protein
MPAAGSRHQLDERDDRQSREENVHDGWSVRGATPGRRAPERSDGMNPRWQGGQAMKSMEPV